MRNKVQFIVADNIKICCVIVYAVSSARSHFSLSLFITPMRQTRNFENCKKASLCCCNDYCQRAGIHFFSWQNNKAQSQSIDYGLWGFCWVL